MATSDGKVPFEAGDKAYTLQFTINRLCLLEERLETTTLMVGAELEMGVSAKTLRAMFWAGLGVKDMTLAQAGDVVDLIGVKAAVALATEAFRATLADDDGEAHGEDENPPKAAIAG